MKNVAENFKLGKIDLWALKGKNDQLAGERKWLLRKLSDTELSLLVWDDEVKVRKGAEEMRVSSQFEVVAIKYDLVKTLQEKFQSGGYDLCLELQKS